MDRGEGRVKSLAPAGREPLAETPRTSASFRVKSIIIIELKPFKEKEKARKRASPA